MDIELNPKLGIKSKTLTTVYTDNTDATLRVVKQVICELPSICTIAPSDFRITVTVNNPVPASFDGSSAGATVNLGLGVFSVTETSPAPPAGLLVHRAP